MSLIEEKLNNFKSDLENDNVKILSDEEYKKRLSSIKKENDKFHFKFLDQEQKNIEIKHQIENLFGVNFCSSDDFKNFIKWLDNN